MRAEKRLKNAIYLTCDSDCCIFLPSEHWMTKFIVKYQHKKNFQVAGANRKLSKLSTQFGIVRVREEMQEVEKKYYNCK